MHTREDYASFTHQCNDVAILCVHLSNGSHLLAGLECFQELEHNRGKLGQGGVTSIDSALPPATGVKIQESSSQNQ